MVIFKKILFTLLVCACLIVLLNFSFFWQNIRFTFVKPRPAEQAAAGKQTAADTLTIDSLGIQAPVIYASGKTEKIFQSALAGGVVHYPDTANPGEPGNVYIFGHSSDLPFSQGNYKTVFALLPRIKKTAEIKLTDNSGKLYVYTVSQSFMAAAGDIKYLQSDASKKILTLQTSYPIGTAWKRWLVIAEIKE